MVACMTLRTPNFEFGLLLRLLTLLLVALYNCCHSELACSHHAGDPNMVRFEIVRTHIVKQLFREAATSLAIFPFYVTENET
ncbi:hypothetical protein WL58_21905 [Burkholderia cepacia]|nr:hypothetical protein WL58_21905 [Burkholderia cepacia]